ncbi:hypothetical protein FisN_1Lh283 [Fistulifera solaris]|uniref:Uncharacterized protein n=1 Tax=Fistulifera solaris TaxID=1519565 RepID=A0A1Z5K494_FISSO|nr:hypothetical protein FisN_1Lh283 [Fistulifera solaris]|eukprot:GAX21045.1 hypothetical protein FisN_1Lh283 [Fistulifera solaris]
MKAGIRGMLRKAREARKKTVDEYQSRKNNKTLAPIDEASLEESRAPEEGREPEECVKPVEQKTKRVPRFFRGKSAKNVEHKQQDSNEVKAESHPVNNEVENVKKEEPEKPIAVDDKEESDETRKIAEQDKEPVLSPQSVVSINSPVSDRSIHSPASSRSSMDDDRDTPMVDSIQSVDSHISIIQSPRGAGIRSAPKTPDYTTRMEVAEDTPVAHSTGFLCGCI